MNHEYDQEKKSNEMGIWHLSTFADTTKNTLFRISEGPLQLDAHTKYIFFCQLSLHYRRRWFVSVSSPRCSSVGTCQPWLLGKCLSHCDPYDAHGNVWEGGCVCVCVLRTTKSASMCVCVRCVNQQKWFTMGLYPIGKFPFDIHFFFPLAIYNLT